MAESNERVRDTAPRADDRRWKTAVGDGSLLLVKRLIVIGGGISGLAAAHAAASELGTDLEVLVLEKAGEVGGKARTESIGPWRVETGPAGYLDGEPALDRLVESAGLHDEVVVANDDAANRFIVRGGEMRAVSPHPLRLARSGILGVSGLLRILGEPFVRRGHGDESVWDFAARRLGPQVADRLVAPMVLGVFAGDAKSLSLAAAFPKLAALESEHGSLLKGMVKSRRAGRSDGAAAPSGTLTSFREGIQTLPLRLAESRLFEVRRNTAVREIRQRTGRWLVEPESGPAIEADAVALACESWAMAKVLRNSSAKLSRLLEEIPCPPVAIVALGFGSSALNTVPRGFGALIPRGEGYRILGVLFDSHVFRGRSPQGTLLVRAFLGGAVDPEAVAGDDQSIEALAVADVSRLLRLDEKPDFRHVIRWDKAIPQYEIGHLERVRAVESELTHLPGLFLAGNALYGIAFSKAAAAGEAAGTAAARYLASPKPSEQ